MYKCIISQISKGIYILHLFIHSISISCNNTNTQLHKRQSNNKYSPNIALKSGKVPGFGKLLCFFGIPILIPNYRLEESRKET